MSETSLLALPYLAAGQAQKHVTLNEALRRLDALVQIGVESRGVFRPPAAPAPGIRYLVPESATDHWSGKGGQIAAWQDGGWAFYPPRRGWLVFVADEARLLVYGLNGWDLALGPLQELPSLGIGTTADTYNRLALRGPASLFTHDETGGHQLKLNKASAGHAASLLFQTGWSGRAEIGTAGSDNLSIKVSGDGASWKEALSVRADGRIGIGDVSQPKAALHVGGVVVVGAYARSALPDAAATGPGALAYVQDAQGGAVMAFSDGTTWRRIADRVPVS